MRTLGEAIAIFKKCNKAPPSKESNHKCNQKCKQAPPKDSNHKSKQNATENATKRSPARKATTNGPQMQPGAPQQRKQPQKQPNMQPSAPHQGKQPQMQPKMQPGAHQNTPARKASKMQPQMQPSAPPCKESNHNCHQKFNQALPTNSIRKARKMKPTMQPNANLPFQGQQPQIQPPKCNQAHFIKGQQPQKQVKFNQKFTKLRPRSDFVLYSIWNTIHRVPKCTESFILNFKKCARNFKCSVFTKFTKGAAAGGGCALRLRRRLRRFCRT